MACTLAAPKEEDFGNLLNVQGILEREVFDGTSVRVVPVLFTGARGQPTCRKMDDDLSGIPIMDADRIEVLLSLIRRGSEKQFIEFLGSPSLFDLREPELG